MVSTDFSDQGETLRLKAFEVDWNDFRIPNRTIVPTFAMGIQSREWLGCGKSVFTKCESLLEMRKLP
jgi:hypothetical protein